LTPANTNTTPMSQTTQNFFDNKSNWKSIFDANDSSAKFSLFETEQKTENKQQSNDISYYRFENTHKTFPFHSHNKLKKWRPLSVPEEQLNPLHSPGRDFVQPAEVFKNPENLSSYQQKWRSNKSQWKLQIKFKHSRAKRRSH